MVILRDSAEPGKRALPSFPASIAKVGKPVILPSSFGGSPRALHQLYLDSMALVARYGRPDFFITCTANPNWPDVQANGAAPAAGAEQRCERECSRLGPQALALLLRRFEGSQRAVAVAIVLGRRAADDGQRASGFSLEALD